MKEKNILADVEAQSQVAMRKLSKAATQAVVGGGEGEGEGDGYYAVVCPDGRKVIDPSKC